MKKNEKWLMHTINTSTQYEVMIEWDVSEVKVIVVEYPDETKCMEKNEFLLPGNTKLDRREIGDVL